MYMQAFKITLVFVLILSGCSTSTDESLIDDSQADTNSLPDLVGEFVSSEHYTTMGEVLLSEENTSLELTNFKTDEGPQLELYLATSREATDFINLGALQGIQGDFSYSIPDAENIDFLKYNYVVVWCVAAAAEFGHAILEEQ